MNACPICGNPIRIRNAKTCSYACRERKKFLNWIKNIQSKFKEPLKNIISDTYNSGKSLLDIAEIVGLSRNNTHGIQNIFNHFGIKRRSGGGFKRGSVTDPASEVYRNNKIRMIHNNPSTDPEIRKKMSQGMAKSLLKNQSEMTKFVVNILKEFNVDFIQEKVVDKYILDFAINNIDLEIDGKVHWERRQRDQKRDRKLISFGWKIIRIQARVDRLPNLRRKLKELILSGQIPSRDQS